VVVGANSENAYACELAERFPNLVFHPRCSLNDVPRFLAAADAVVIPQRDTRFARAQLPAKLIDAMAMARPIVATAVSDIPQLLDGCARVVRPGDVRDITCALSWILEHPHEAEAGGRRARERVIRELSYEAGRRVLLDALRTARDHAAC